MKMAVESVVEEQQKEPVKTVDREKVKKIKASVLCGFIISMLDSKLLNTCTCIVG